MDRSAGPRARRFASSRKQQAATTGEITQGLLRRLRDISGLSRGVRSSIRRQPTNGAGLVARITPQGGVASAQPSCATASNVPSRSVSFGRKCGVFAHSGTTWAIVARDNNREGEGGRAVRLWKAGQDVPPSLHPVCADAQEGRAT